VAGAQTRLRGSAGELVGALVEQRDSLRRDVLDDSLGGKAGAGADVDRQQRLIVESREPQRGLSHRRRPEQRIDPAVVE
jgi:hypothetical protein